MDGDLSSFGAASQTLAAAFLLWFWDVAAVLPRNSVRESGTRFSYTSFWVGFRVQKLTYENRVPDYRKFVSGRSFLPPFHFSLGETSESCLGTVLGSKAAGN